MKQQQATSTGEGRGTHTLSESSRRGCPPAAWEAKQPQLVGVAGHQPPQAPPPPPTQGQLGCAGPLPLSISCCGGGGGGGAAGAMCCRGTRDSSLLLGKARQGKARVGARAEESDFWTVTG